MSKLSDAVREYIDMLERTGYTPLERDEALTTMAALAAEEDARATHKPAAKKAEK